MNYNEIKYFPDRFYAGLDGVKKKDIRSLNRDIGFKKKHAPIFHEYYHYLINLSTCAGVRQFSINFFDRFRIITRMASVLGINAFPINNNNHKSTYDDVRYWKDVCKFLKEDNIDRDLAKRFGKNFPSFKITKIERIRKDNKFKINGIKRIGTTTRIKVHISDCYERDSFYLTFGALDEFFCTAIDEYFFSQDLSTLTSEFLLNRPYYPYRCLDAFLNYYLEFRPTIIEKILITYTALNSKNPADSFISILERIKAVGEDEFRKDAENFLRKDASLKLVSIEIVDYIKRFENEAKSQGRSKIVEATGYFCDIFEKALLLRQTDPFYFIRPFLETNSQNHIDIDNFNKSFFDILEKFPLPIIVLVHQKVE